MVVKNDLYSLSFMTIPCGTDESYEKKVAFVLGEVVL